MFNNVINIIVAFDSNGGISKNNSIPWKDDKSIFQKDMVRFKELTKNNVCLFGKNTYLEMLEMRQKSNKEIVEILPGRTSVVISSTLSEVKGASISNDLETTLKKFDKEPIFILGGERIFTESLQYAKNVYVTKIKNDYQCDKFFPYDYLNEHFSIKSINEFDSFEFIDYSRF